MIPWKGEDDQSQIDLPDDVRLTFIAPYLLIKMGLPVMSRSGKPTSYRFFYGGSSCHEIRFDQTLAEAGMRAGDYFMHPLRVDINSEDPDPGDPNRRNIEIERSMPRLISPQAVHLIVRHLDQVDRAVASRMNRKRPWLETSLTSLLCDLLDAETQNDERLDYTLAQLNDDLSNRDGLIEIFVVARPKVNLAVGPESDRPEAVKL